MSGYVSARFDFPGHTAATRTLVVASSYRSGSTYLGLSLWSDGRFGAPFEYFNFEKHMDYMMARLGGANFDDYIERLMEIRTSGNGVFSVKSHFHHFLAACDRSMRWKEYCLGAKFLYVNRTDKLAQAVSMAKALQNNSWMSFSTPRKAPLFYSKELIEQCLAEVMDQAGGWWRWFEENDVEPYVVNYEEFVEDAASHVRKIARWLGVDDGDAKQIDIPMIERQSDAVNIEWYQRFIADRRAGERGD